MEFLIDIIDERLAAGDDDVEQLRRYFELWRAGAVDPLRDPGVVVIATLDPGPRLLCVGVNDGEGGYAPAVGPGRRAA